MLYENHKTLEIEVRQSTQNDIKFHFTHSFQQEKQRMLLLFVFIESTAAFAAYAEDQLKITSLNAMVTIHSFIHSFNLYQVNIIATT